MNLYRAEVYVDGPQRQTGWDIKFVHLHARTKSRAIELLAGVPQIDSLISVDEIADDVDLSHDFFINSFGEVFARISLES